MSVFKKKYLTYLAGIGGKDDKGKRRVKQVQHSTSSPVVYIAYKWGGKWTRVDEFDVQSIELRSASVGEDTCVLKYRYGYIAYPNAPGKRYRTVKSKRFTGKTMWVRIKVDKLTIFQGVLTNIDDEFYGRGKDNDANTQSGVQTFTFKGGLYLLSRFRFYQSFWYSGEQEDDEISPPKEKIIDWIPDFGGESPEYCNMNNPEMEIQKTTLGNIVIYEKEVKDADGKNIKKWFVAFGGNNLFSPEGSFAYLSNLIDLNKWNGPKFDVDLRYIHGEIAGKQISSEPVMNARDFLLRAFDVDSGYDFYFEPTSEGYTIVPFPRQDNDTYFWINPQHTAVVNCTLSRDTDDYYTAVRVVGERVVYNLLLRTKPHRVKSPVGVSIEDKNEDGALTMFDLFSSRKDYTTFSLPDYTIEKSGAIAFNGKWFKPFVQTKFRKVLSDFYYDENGKEIKENVPRIWFDGRAYNRAHGGDGGNDNNILWLQTNGLEIGIEPFKQAIGARLKVKHWARLLDGIQYGFDDGEVVSTGNSPSTSFSDMHKPEANFPIDLRKLEVPDICDDRWKVHFAVEGDQRFQYIFGDYQDEYRTLTVYEKGARLVLYYDFTENVVQPEKKVSRNDFVKLKARYEAILKEFRQPTAEITCQIKGLLSPAVLGKRITIAGDNVSQVTNTSLTHISYSFPEGKSPQTRI